MSESPTICTIIAKNYLAHARVLCSSFLEHHPNGKCYVLAVDEWRGFIDPTTEQFTLVSLDDIGLPEPLDVFCFKYNVTELCTAVKPFFLEWLFAHERLDRAIYLDPDILVTASLDALFQRLDSANALLIPHLDTPYPNDGLLPDDRHILISGIFNLGFLGVRSSDDTSHMLRWLQEKLSDNCVIDHARGFFVDQRFFDIAFNVFQGIEIERGTAYNVAYWNLHSRYLSRDAAGTWLCNGEPLRFFHFSDYRAEKPDVISRHTTRYNLSNRSDLQPLFAQYRRRLEGSGYNEVRQWPYGFATFAQGREISNSFRRRFREWPVLRGNEKNPFASRRLLRAARILDTAGRNWHRLRCIPSRLLRLLRIHT